MFPLVQDVPERVPRAIGKLPDVQSQRIKGGRVKLQPKKKGCGGFGGKNKEGLERKFVGKGTRRPNATHRLKQS